MSAQLRSTSHGKTMILTLSHPDHHNALTPAMMAAGIEALNVAEGNVEISAVVLLGEGTNFCAGLAPLSVSPSEDDSSTLALFPQWLETLRTFPKPVIAALEGEVYDEGLLSALNCDLLIAAVDCQLSALRLAMRPALMATHAGLLASRLPRALAFELLTGQAPIAPQRLQACGLINQICTSGHAQTTALAIADRYAATPSAQEVMHVKDLLANVNTVPAAI